MAESLGIMPFGKHKGKEIEEIPDSYLEWFVGEKDIREKNKTLCENIKKELKYREQWDCHIERID